MLEKTPALTRAFDPGSCPQSEELALHGFQGGAIGSGGNALAEEGAGEARVLARIGLRDDRRDALYQAYVAVAAVVAAALATQDHQLERRVDRAGHLIARQH